MKKEVLLTVKGLHTGENREDDSLELTNPAVYALKNGSHFVVYDEMDESGRTTKTRMKFSPDRLEVTRSGVLSSHLLFERGKKNLSIYKTPYGEILLAVATSEILLKEGDGEISLTVTYEMDMNGEPAAQSRVTILIRPTK